jgi:hypothetical protein
MYNKIIFITVALFLTVRGGRVSHVEFDTDFFDI